MARGNARAAPPPGRRARLTPPRARWRGDTHIRALPPRHHLVPLSPDPNGPGKQQTALPVAATADVSIRPEPDGPGKQRVLCGFHPQVLSVSIRPEPDGPGKRGDMTQPYVTGSFQSAPSPMAR